MRKAISGILLGIAFVGAGVIFAGNALGLWNISIFFDGWWTLFIIIPCTLNIFETGFNTSNSIGLSVGVLLLLSQQDIIDYDIIWSIFVALLLIIIGLNILFKQSSFSKNFKRESNVDIKGGYHAIFGGHEIRLPHQEFKGTSLSAVFGGLELDLADAIITSDIYIDVMVAFGGIDIKVPSQYKVIHQGLPILGAISNKRNNSVSNDGPIIYINGTCFCGGIEVL